MWRKNWRRRMLHQLPVQQRRWRSNIQHQHPRCSQQMRFFKKHWLTGKEILKRTQVYFKVLEVKVFITELSFNLSVACLVHIIPRCCTPRNIVDGIAFLEEELREIKHVQSESVFSWFEAYWKKQIHSSASHIKH